MSLPVQPRPVWLSSMHGWKGLLLAALAACTVISLITAGIYQRERQSTLANLAIIAQWKASEIERWLTDHRSSMYQPPSGYLANSLEHWLHQPHPPESDAELDQALAFYRKRYPEVSKIWLANAQGHFVRGTAATANSLPVDAAELSQTPSGDTRLFDFHTSPDEEAHLDFASPLTLRSATGERRIGFVIFQLEPKIYLYPFIAQWPGITDSGESLLYRANNGNIEYLNPLRHDPAPPLSVRRPLNTPGLLSAELLKTHSLTAEGHDYRGVSALGATWPIPNSPWHIIAQQNKSELYASVARESTAPSLLVLFGMSALLSLLRRHQAGILRAQHERDMHLLRTFIDAVPETLVMLHTDGTILTINQTGAHRVGSTPERLVGHSMWNQLPPEAASVQRAAIEQACHSGEPVTLNHKHAEVEFLSLIYPLDDGLTAVVIDMDVTARNADARAMREAMRTLQGFIDHLPGLAYVKNHESRVLTASSGFQTLLGIAPASMIGKLSNEIFPGEFGDRMAADDLRIFTTGETEIIEETLNDRRYETIKFVIPREDAPPDLGGITLDITARHHAEEAARISESRLRHLTDNLPESYLYQIVIEPNGHRYFQHISSGVQDLHGISPEAVLADPNALYSLIDPAQANSLHILNSISQAEMRDFNMEFHARRSNGEYGVFMARSRPRHGTGGDVIWDGVVTDVTQARRDAGILNMQSRRAEAMLELPMQAEQSDESSFLAYAQDIAEQLTGSQIAFTHFIHEDEEMIELTAWSHNTLAHYCHAMFDKHYPVSQAGIWADSVRKRAPVIINDYASAPNKRGLPDGHSHLQRLISVPVIERGRVRMIAGVGNKPEDYSELDVESLQLIANETWRIICHRRQQNALLASEAHFRAFFERSMIGMATLTPDQHWQDVNEALCHMLGYSKTEMQQTSWTELTHPDDLPDNQLLFNRILSGETNEFAVDKRFVHKDGEFVDAAVAVRCIRKQDGSPDYLVALIENISQRKQREREIITALETQRQLNMKLEEAHNQLLQSEKLAAIGQLAAGVAHELNNPIGFVTSNLGTLTEYATALVNICDEYTLATESQTLQSPHLAEVERIKQEQDYNYLRGDIFPLLTESRDGLIRVRKIVQDLRDFSRTGTQEWGMADLLKGLDSTLNIVANELKYKCTVHKKYTALPEVICVISQINQVFMNLLVNAAQAIETTGEITLSSGQEGADKVWISIKDNGKGIQPEHLNRIFEPFFTTKPVGVGTGLGLSLAFGIINRHHGHIEVSSTPGEGTTFRIVLPINQTTETPHT